MGIVVKRLTHLPYTIALVLLGLGLAMLLTLAWAGALHAKIMPKGEDWGIGGAVKTGAFDFIEKPVDEDNLLDVVESALLKDMDLNDPLVGKPLTRSERIVLCLILEGISNKRIAYILERSERTIEVHRSHIMRKLNVDNVVDLVKRASSLSGLEKSE